MAMGSEVVPPRVMPNPWFSAQVSAFTISELLRPEPFREAGPGERQLGPFVLPPFQRPPVWSRAQQIKLLESIWDGLPIGSCVFNQSEYSNECDAWLLDGQQRITAILAYASDKFPVFGYRFSGISVPEQRGFRNKPIGTLMTRIDDRARCEEVYNRLAYGGTAHAPQNAGGEDG